MLQRLAKPKRHSKACAAMRRRIEKTKLKRCICGKDRFLWMYQPGDVLELSLRGQTLTVCYAWDNFKKAPEDKALSRGCHVRVTDSLGPLLWLPAWTQVASEVQLYVPPAMLGGDEEEVDPLKGVIA